MYKQISSLASSCTIFALLSVTISLPAQEPEAAVPAKLPAINATEAARLAGAPTLLTLHVENGKAKDVFAEIRKQLGLPPGSNDSQLEHDNTPVTLHIDGQPFWTAMRTVAMSYCTTGSRLVVWLHAATSALSVIG